MKQTWFDIGYNAGECGLEAEYPENSFARNNYRMGYEAGDWAKVCEQNNWPRKTREQAKQAAGY